MATTRWSKETATDLLRDPARLRERLVSWVREQVEGAGLSGAIFGLSGGVDSAVVCGLAAEALGPERCLGVIMPIESAGEDARLAREVADHFGVAGLRQDLSEQFRSLHATLRTAEEAAFAAAGGARRAEPESPASTAAAEEPAGREETRERLAAANLKPRLRMITLYYYANLLDYMVLGTGNRAEFTLGYFTKWGDGAADAFPLAGLLKHEVWAVARELGVPADVVDRAPTAGLWTGQTDEEELGIRYADIDRYLATGSTGDADTDAEIRRREKATRHKVAPPPQPDLS